MTPPAAAPAATEAVPEAAPAAPTDLLDMGGDAPAAPAEGESAPTEAAPAAPAAAPAPAAPTPQQLTKTLDLVISGTLGLAPVPMTEDEVSNYIATHAQDHLGQQSAQALAFEKLADPEAAVSKLTTVVAKAAGLCYLHGIQ